MAKKVALRSIRVLDATGSGTFSDIVSGIQLVVNYVATYKAGQPITTVINMSLVCPGFALLVSSSLVN